MGTGVKLEEDDGVGVATAAVEATAVDGVAEAVEATAVDGVAEAGALAGRVPVVDGVVRGRGGRFAWAPSARTAPLCLFDTCRRIKTGLGAVNEQNLQLCAALRVP